MVAVLVIYLVLFIAYEVRFPHTVDNATISVYAVSIILSLLPWLHATITMVVFQRMLDG